MTRHLVSDGLTGGIIIHDNAPQGGDYTTWELSATWPNWTNGVTLSTLDSNFIYFAEAFVNGYNGSGIYHTTCLFNPLKTSASDLQHLDGSSMRFRIDGGVLQFKENSSGGGPLMVGHCRKVCHT